MKKNTLGIIIGVSISILSIVGFIFVGKKYKTAQRKSSQTYTEDVEDVTDSLDNIVVNDAIEKCIKDALKKIQQKHDVAGLSEAVNQTLAQNNQNLMQLLELILTNLQPIWQQIAPSEDRIMLATNIKAQAAESMRRFTNYEPKTWKRGIDKFLQEVAWCIKKEMQISGRQAMRIEELASEHFKLR